LDILSPTTHLGYGPCIRFQGPSELGKGRLFLLDEELLLAKCAGQVHDLQQIASSWGLHGAAGAAG